MINKFNLFFLTLFSVGRIKYAPGTIASLITCLTFLLLLNVFSIITLFFCPLIIFCYSFIAINNSFKSFNSTDPQEIVIDEVVGQMLPLLAIPIYETLHPISKEYYCIGAFVLFRFFDIWKPFPVSYFYNNIKGALGIMLDYIAASFYDIRILILIFFFLGR